MRPLQEESGLIGRLAHRGIVAELSVIANSL
jgi:hypothetical protein